MAVRDVPVVTLKKIVDAPPADARISAARVLFPPTEASVRTINSFWTSANEEPTRTVKCASGPSCGMDIDGKAQVERMIHQLPSGRNGPFFSHALLARHPATRGQVSPSHAICGKVSGDHTKPYPSVSNRP